MQAEDHGDLFVGGARDFLLDGHLFHLKLTGNRRDIAERSVIDNFEKWDITRSEHLVFGIGFGIVTDVQTAPNGNLVVVWLYPEGPPPELIPNRFSGVLAEGTITSDDLVGPLSGMTLADLLELMVAGETYVNIHTSQFPAGEIRGQIRPAGAPR